MHFKLEFHGLFIPQQEHSDRFAGELRHRGFSQKLHIIFLEPETKN
ncbi:hypothetical protein [Nostoc sp.]